MKVKRVFGNNRKKAFVVETNKGVYEFPYSQLSLKPSKSDSLARVAPERAIGSEGFTYVLQSGASDTVHIDHVLRYAQDADYLREELIFKLTIEAKRLISELHFTKREVARRMKTSPSQLYRLLDPTFYGKTLDQMVSLLHCLGHRVDLVLRKEAA